MYTGLHGDQRSTFVIKQDGTVLSAMYGVKPDTHTERVLKRSPARRASVIMAAAAGRSPVGQP